MKTRTVFLLSIVLVCALAVSAQPQPQPQQSPAASPATSPPAQGAQRPGAPEPPKDKPFADIVKDAQVIKGLFTLYRTEDKVFLEILPDHSRRCTCFH